MQTIKQQQLVILVLCNSDTPHIHCLCGFGQINKKRKKLLNHKGTLQENINDNETDICSLELTKGQI